MEVGINPSSLKQTQWHEYFIRFLLGGAITAITGLIGHKFGAAVGGLFLAYPAIFPSAATLIEKHESEKKEGLTANPKKRGRQAASLEARGCVMGSIGLSAFAAVVWLMAPSHSAAMVLLLATAAWAAVAIGIWKIRRLV
jgi:Protein of unknown function (DUF3147)